MRGFPLHHAGRNGHTSTVELLLNNGALTEAMDKDNNTLLHLAAWNGYPGVVELLLNKGSSIEAMNQENNTHCMLQYGMAILV